MRYRCTSETRPQKPVLKSEVKKMENKEQLKKLLSDIYTIQDDENLMNVLQGVIIGLKVAKAS